MGLGAGTPDRARVRREAPTGERVEGSKLTSVVYSPEFRCRYRPASETESRDQGRVRRVRPATLTVVRYDVTGAPVDLGPNDRVEITQAADGSVILMEVQGAPQPIRKRRTVIGWTATLQRVTN